MEVEIVKMEVCLKKMEVVVVKLEVCFLKNGSFFVCLFHMTVTGMFTEWD